MIFGVSCMTMKVSKAIPAWILTVGLVVLLFAAALVRPGVGAVVQANGAVIGSLALLLVGWWAGTLVARAKGSMVDVALGGLGVGVVHAIAAVVLFGYAAGQTAAIGAPGGLLDQNMVQTVVAIAGAVAGSGIMK